MIYYIKEILFASFAVFLDSAPFMLAGFFMAGLLKAFVPDNWVSSHLNGKGIWSVIKASAIGVPIPLCSCGVVPTAAGLKDKGADKGAVASFMISTPETGIDSISVTWALLDPFMTFIRPAGAFITAVLAGFLISTTDRSSAEVNGNNGLISESGALDSGCNGAGCCCSATKQEESKKLISRFTEGMHFAFVELIDDIGAWFLTGVFIAGFISTFLKPEIIETYIGKGLSEMLVMLFLSIPLYVCATSSTPIAAALIAKGISPGAALVFLLAGPATNAATVLVTSRILGKKNTLIYVLTIAVCSLGLGYLTNFFYLHYNTNKLFSVIHENKNQTHGLVYYLSTIILSYLILNSLKKRLLKNQRFSLQ